MALYSIESEQCLGMSHHGAVTVNGASAVELSDEEVDPDFVNASPCLIRD